MAEQYGNVYSLKMGPVWTVVLNGFSTLQEGLSKGDHMSDRPAFPIHTDVLPDLGIVFASGYSWKQQRQFALSTLKYFGVGKKSHESSILEEFRYMSKEIASHKGKPFDLHFLIERTPSPTSICALIFGVQIEGSIWAQLYNAFPVLMRRLPGPHHTLQKDFIDCFLTEIQKHQDKRDDEPDACFDGGNLVKCSFDLFGAGTETTSITLRWGVLYMAKYTEIQEKVQKEIDSVIGQSREPSMEDRPNMPYTDAVIHEIQRIGNVVPHNLPHVTNRDVQIGGYTIPKGVIVMPNLTSVLFDKNEWETPNTFNPWTLSEQGGENLARIELFLLFTSFLQRFTFSMPPGVEAVFKPRVSIFLSPQPYQICATLREE
ncbi:hypothetical protein KUCAC02_023206 [Chaenocephalus aceratus]|uniref:Uncharacterized protein n=1 Tax=Chaenocephalus aceratus TaxID=36190 RepID=A0ACB9XR31_CHAAC|nr:hypothetical protein KUCAC02_023206 [Chaenocephalus aceratus]